MSTKSINDRLGDGGFESVAVFEEVDGVPTGLIGPDGITYPLITRAVEVLDSSAVAVSCSSSAVDEVLASYTIAAGTLGVNSIIQIEPLWSCTDSVNNKIFRIKIGGTQVYNTTRGTGVQSEGPMVAIANRNSLSSQIKTHGSLFYTSGSNLPSTYTIDFSATVELEITGQRANIADTLTLEYYRILHYTGA